jgi:tetratricopeptide (TPR) repeat protein
MVAVAVVLVAAGCGSREGHKASPPPSPSPSPPPAPIAAPDASLRPIVRPPGVGLDAGAVQKLRRRELYLEGVIARGSGKQDLAAAYGELGKIYHAFGLPESAVPCYENAGRLAPAAFEWPYLLAMARWQAHQGDEAVAAMERALGLRPDDLTALVFLGDVHRATGQLEPARKAYARAVQVSPRCAPALYGLGEIASLEGDHRRAIQLFESALKEQPQANRIHYPLSLAYARVGAAEKSKAHLAQRGDVDAAVPDPVYESVLRLNPFTYARRGQDALMAGNIGAALEMLRPAVQALPEDPEVRMHLGAALARSGDLEGALEQYREAVRLKPTNPRAHYNLGTTLTSLGRDEEALDPLRRAVQLHPEYRQALFNLAQDLRRLGRDSEALPLLDQAITVAPTHEPSRLARARLLAHVGRCRDAVAGLEEGLTIVPKSRPLKGFLARMLAACTTDTAADGPRAVKLAEQVFAEEGTADNAANLAFIHAALGGWKEAARWQRRAIALVPRDTRAEAEPTLTEQLQGYEAQRVEVKW